MRVLVACEFSGIDRDAFRAQGHDAWSCDLLPTERPGPHIQGDAIEAAYGQPWDLMIAHPPCQYLAVSGARWFKDPARQQPQADALAVGETKATCLWLKNLPPLVPTDIVEGREPRVHRASPGPDRWKDRSRTLPGIAAAMAAQWGGLALEAVA
jgi:hypothetical protein